MIWRGGSFYLIRSKVPSLHFFPSSRVVRRTFGTPPPLARKKSTVMALYNGLQSGCSKAPSLRFFPSSPCAGRNEKNTYGRRNASPTTVFCFITVGEGSPLPQCSKHSKRGYTRFDFCVNEQAKINTPTVGAFCERPRAHPADAPAHRLRYSASAMRSF